MIRRLFLFILLAVAVLTSCSDDDSFSADRGNVLTFSVDTLKMDTVFSTVPSSTYTFWIRNQSADGIRIQSARLERAGQSGFRVNVDGTFLDPVATGLEVRKGDSLLVFVEATTRMTGVEGPQLVEDNLVMELESGVVQKLNLRTWSWDADKLTTLRITEDTVIQAQRPVVVYDSIVVEQGVALTLRHTSLYFHDGAKMIVYGSLIADSCTLRGDRLDHMFDYLPYDRISAQWQGVRFMPTSQGNMLKDSEFRNAVDAIQADSCDVQFVNCVVHNTSGYGIAAYNADIQLDNCQLTNCGADCLLADGGTVSVSHSTLAQFYPYSANRGAALRFGTGRYGLQLDCQKTLVTGYESDVVFGEQGDTTLLYNLHFQDCLLRTDSITGDERFEGILWETPKDSIEGKKHFKTIDEDNLYYDFTIDSISPAFLPRIGRYPMNNTDSQ